MTIFFGAVYRDLNGALQTQGPCPQRAFDNWFTGQQNGAEVLSLVCGPDNKRATIAEVLNDIKHVEECYKNAALPAHPNPPAGKNDAYVYLYFRDCRPAWNNVFYIGMKGDGPVRGTPRHDQHIEGTLKKHATRRPLTLKEKMILNEMPKVAAAAGMAAINTYADYCEALRHLEAAGKQLNRRTLFFTSGDKAARAFCTEYHLISSLYGAFSVSNDTNGNNNVGDLRAISRPKAFSGGKSWHRQWWSDACEYFIKHEGVVSAQDEARLKLMDLETLAERFQKDWLDSNKPLDGLIKSLPDLEPKDGISPCFAHVHVANGQDATMNYEIIGKPTEKGPSPVKDPPFRLELKANATTPAVRINLRPATGGKKAREAFVRHIQKKVTDCYEKEPISNPKGESFFKPFAPAAEGRNDTDFEMFPIYTKSTCSEPGYCWPDWHPDRHASPQLELDIGEAIKAVLTHLL